MSLSLMVPLGPRFAALLLVKSRGQERNKTLFHAKPTILISKLCTFHAYPQLILYLSELAKSYHPARSSTTNPLHQAPFTKEQSDPTAHYDLNLEHPQHRALLRMLLRQLVRCNINWKAQRSHVSAKLVISICVNVFGSVKLQTCLHSSQGSTKLVNSQHGPSGLIK